VLLISKFYYSLLFIWFDWLWLWFDW